MDHYAGLDISLEETSVRIVNNDGKVIRETKVATDPDALAKEILSMANIKVEIVKLDDQARDL